MNSINTFWENRIKIMYILCIMVVLIHVKSFSYYQSDYTIISHINNFISVFFTKIFNKLAVPLFFILSASAFFRNYNNAMYFSKIKTRFKSLVIPYLLWNTILMCLFLITSHFNLDFMRFNNVDISFSNFIHGIFVKKYNPEFWFICNLIIYIYISVPFTEIMIKNKKVGLLYIISVILIIYGLIGFTAIRSYLFVLDLTICYIYFLVGAFIGKHYFDSLYNISKKIIIISFIIFCMISFYNILSYIGLIKIPDAGIFNTLYALSFYFIVYKYICPYIKKSSLHNDSFGIYAMHYTILFLLSYLFYNLFPKNNFYAIPNFILSVSITLTVIHSVCYFLRKYTPKISVYLLGGR